VVKVLPGSFCAVSGRQFDYELPVGGNNHIDQPKESMASSANIKSLFWRVLILVLFGCACFASLGCGAAKPVEQGAAVFVHALICFTLAIAATGRSDHPVVDSLAAAVQQFSKSPATG